MTRWQASRIVRHFDTMKAFAEGQDVLYRTDESQPWKLIKNPGFNGAGEYRIFGSKASTPTPDEDWAIT